MPLRFVAVVGPTASGKSELAIELALRVGGEVINYDSLQVYRFFDIGTAKVPPSERRGVPHHLLDVVNPDEEFNAYMYKEMAEEVVRGVISRGKVPILVGGTGLYLRALEKGLFPQEDVGPYREMAERMIEEKGLSRVYDFLISVDKRLSYIHRGDRVRIRRALELYLMTGKSMVELWERGGDEADVLKIGLMPPRDVLYRKVGERFEEMLKKGFVEEVEWIVEKFGMGIKPIKSIGYREMLLYITGYMGLDEAVRVAVKRTKVYARRQIIWFRREKVLWFEPPYPMDRIVEAVERFWGCSS